MRKNKKRINPRYFLHETALREDEHPEYGEGYATGFKRPQDVEGDFIVYYDVGEGKSVYNGFDNLETALKEAKELMGSERHPKEIEIYSKVESKWGKGHIWGSKR